VEIEGWKMMTRRFIMFKKRMDYAKEISSLKKRIEEAENSLAIIRVQYALMKSDRNRLKEILSEKN
jgi:hypothetical protein